MGSLPVLWRPHPGFQTRFLASPHREVLGGGAAGPGKTDCLIYGALRYIDQPWCRVLFLRLEYGDLLQIIQRTQTVFPSLGAEWRASERLWRFPSGATYRFAAATRLVDLVQDHQGSEYTEIAWDELGLVQDEAMWSWIKTRCRSPDPRAVIRYRASANPGGPGNAWLKARFVEPCGRDGGSYYDPVTQSTIAFIPGKLSDNPTIDSAERQEYRRDLMGQPEAVRRALLDGDWDMGLGLAFPELSEAHHEPVRTPEPWWPRWGSLDWGFAHWTVVCDLTCDDDGTVHVVDTLWVRRLQPDQLAEMIWERMPVHLWRTVYAGHDLWHEHRARGYEGPTMAQQFHAARIPVVKADIDRIQGFSQLRDRIAFRGRGEPRIRFMHTPGNLRLIKQLKGLIEDPDRREDVLKVDAKAEGMHDDVSGDDGYDALRYGVLSYIRSGKRPLEDLSPFDPRSLQHVAVQERITRPKPPALTSTLEGVDWW